jgi:transcriptional antiterminator RfaH
MENWYVLFTKPRQEKNVTSQLLNLGIKAYCPMITTIRQWSDRKKKVLKPLIASCVFIQSEENNRKNVFLIPGASHYLFWLGKPAIVKNSEIETIQEYIKGGISETLVQALKIGDPYILENSGFNGQEGIINEVSKNRVQLILKELGMKITITRNQNT